MASVSTHQDLMDKAYKIWEQNGNMLYGMFLNEVETKLGKLYLNAIITGNLNYQVENGGFSQWKFNDYDVSLDQLINFFNDNFPDNETVKKLVWILKDVKEQIEWVEDGKYKTKNLYDHQDFFNDALNDYLSDNLSKNDSAYYKISEEINEILEKYFTEKLGETLLDASPESKSVIESSN